MPDIAIPAHMRQLGWSTTVFGEPATGVGIFWTMLFISNVKLSPDPACVVCYQATDFPSFSLTTVSGLMPRRSASVRWSLQSCWWQLVPDTVRTDTALRLASAAAAQAGRDHSAELVSTLKCIFWTNPRVLFQMCEWGLVIYNIHRRSATVFPLNQQKLDLLGVSSQLFLFAF